MVAEVPISDAPVIGIEHRWPCGCWMILEGSEVVGVGPCRMHMRAIAVAIAQAIGKDELERRRRLLELEFPGLPLTDSASGASSV